MNKIKFPDMFQSNFVKLAARLAMRLNLSKRFFNESFNARQWKSGKPVIFMLLSFMLMFAAVGTFQAKEFTQPEKQVIVPQKTGSIFSLKTENVFSFNLANQIAALSQSQTDYHSFNNLTANQAAVNLSVASTFTVTNLNDSGAGSLRQAIINANSDPDVSSIAFNIDAAAPYTINVQSGLPAISTTMTIDATTQPGFDGAPIIELNGAGAGGSNGFFVNSGNSVIKGFVINRFGGAGIGITGSNNTVAGNFIGTNASGTAAMPNNGDGVILIGASGNTIGGSGAGQGNIISGNQFAGVALKNNATNNRILGNYFGTNASGTAAIPNSSNGILIINNSSGNIIGGTESGAGNLFSGNLHAGVIINNSANNQVLGNRIGTNAAGTAAVPNGFSGIAIDNSSSNIIGGSQSGASNLISGNLNNGVLIANNAANNQVIGNRVGTNAAGTAAVPNAHTGIAVDNSSGNIIGGTELGARNVVSGNTFSGIAIYNNSANNQVIGNRVGTNSDGTAAIANLNEGVHLSNASNNIIGGSAAGQGNLISGNTNQGVGIFNNSANNQVLGNRIGTNADGTAAIPNGFNGIAVDNSSGNVIGGTEPGARNVVSGNGSSGVSIYNNSANNQIIGNYSGTSADGTAAVPNFYDGIVIVNSNGNIIGGTQSGAGNLVSGNLSNGILIINNAANNQVIGNRVGTNSTGTTAIANTNSGIVVDNSSNNTIGGTEPGAGNLTSGNNGSGILLTNNSTNNRISGNYVGVNAAGTAAIKNNGHGIYVTNSSGNIIGGTESGARNVTSGNRYGGIVLIANATNNRVIGNYSGTNTDGSAAIPNGYEGISIDNVSGNIIGGTEPGAGNLFSGNATQGIFIQNNSTNNQILGNRVGTNASGNAAIPNNATGVIVNNSNGNFIGGTQAGAGNLISGNFNGGASIFGSSTGNIFQGNLIGTDVTGTIALGNIGNGIGIGDSSGNIIGGTSPAARNIISGNRDGTPVNGTGHGIVIGGSNASSNVVQGNYIGTNAGGNQKIANARGGVFISNGGNNNTVAGNLLSGNNFDGISIQGVSGSSIPAHDNSVKGNLIGTDASGTIALGNNFAGVRLTGNNNKIGGTAEGDRNIIAFNRTEGISVSTGTGNAILSNSIYSNGGLGIAHFNNGNNNQAAPTISSAYSDGNNGAIINGQLSNSAANADFNIQFFSNASCDPSGAGEGQTYLGSTSVTTDASGNAIFSFSQAVLSGQIITATATDSSNNTSQFSQCISVSSTADCIYTLIPTSSIFSAGSSVGNTISVATSNSDCPWTAVSNAPWITITGGSAGGGNGTVTFAVAQNDGTARIGTITIAGQTFTVSQQSGGGAAPANDNFGNAQTIGGNSGNMSGSTTGATAEAGEPFHAGVTPSHSIWFKWRAPEDGLYSFTTVGSSFDTVLAVYTGSSLGQLNPLTSNDDNTAYDPTSKVVFRAIAGGDYYIAVDGKNGASGIVNLSWKQAARTYRFYAQTGNGDISPRIPVITAVRDGDGARFVAQNIATGVYELDLPVDNATYQVSIGGADQWSPNSFALDNSSFNEANGTNNEASGNRSGERAESAASGTTGGNLVTTAVTIAATVSGELRGVRSIEGVTVLRGSDGGPNPIAPTACDVSLSAVSGTVVYSCQFIVDTKHQIKPTLAGTVFTPRYIPFPQPLSASLPPSEGTAFTTATAPTYNISGRVTAGGINLAGAQVSLSGTKINSFITGEDGAFAFNNLPAGGNYVVQATLAGYTFAAQSVNNLPADVVLNLAAQSSCAYALSVAESQMSAGGGTGSFRVATGNNCPWTAQNTASWVTFNRSGGNGTEDVFFTVAANAGAARTTLITVGGQTFTLMQAEGCAYSFSQATDQRFGAAGGAGSFRVTASDGTCRWMAEASDYCQISLSGAATGNGVVSFTVEPNRGVARSAQITVGGRSFDIEQEAAAGSHRAAYDFDGDGKADIAVFRPSNGTWYLNLSQGGTLGVGFGQSGDRLVAADYDGDGLTDLAVYRNGIWYIQRTSLGFFSYAFGDGNDIPQPADFDGDGKAELVVFRPSNGVWYTFNLASGQNTTFGFGQSGDKPVVGDYDGDGKADYAVYRSGIWYLQRSRDGFLGYAFGAADDKPVQADYDGDGKTDIAVFRPINGVWYQQQSSSGFVSQAFGAPDDQPTPADYNGDGRADIAVYRPAEGNWYIWSCTANARFATTRFGAATDVPVQSVIFP